MPRSSAAKGLAYGLGAYLVWGLSPIYFKALARVPPLEILSHRIVWSALLLGGLLLARGRLGEALGPARDARRFATLAASTLLVSGNWLLYIWAVNEGRILEASLGYFVNPLVSVVLGVVFLRERLGGRQSAAVALAAGGVLWFLWRLGTLPWVSLTLAASFGVYGLVRKAARIDPVGGLFFETGLLAAPALAFLGARGAAGAGAFGSAPGTTALLALAGVVTAVPLVWFTIGVQRLRLSTMGFLQYLAPSCQLALAVAVYGEPFTAAHAVTFAAIWASLALYSADAFASRRAARPAPAPVE